MLVVGAFEDVKEAAHIVVIVTDLAVIIFAELTLPALVSLLIIRGLVAILFGSLGD